MRILLAVAAGLLLQCSAAQAQWLNRSIEDPFGKDNIIAAFTGAEGKGFLVRCVGGNKLNARFVPNEKGSDEMELLINTVGAKMLVRIDSAPVDTIETTLHNSDDKFIAESSIDLALAERMASAKTRIAVALEIMDKRFASVSFGVRGSGPSIRKVTAACAAMGKPS